MSSSNQARFFRLACAPEEVQQVEQLLLEEGFRFGPVQDLPWARELYSGPDALGSSLAAVFGLIYIQDKASLLPPLYLNPESGSRVLDLCASPGGKTGFLAQLSGIGGLVVANEPAGRRFELLRRNMARLNLLQVLCSAYKAQTIPLGQADWSQILLDVPCSGWGTADKHPRVLKLWQGKRLQPLLSLQRELLSSAGQFLAPGGRLLYCTCTTNVQENEQQILWVRDNLGLEIEGLTAHPDYTWSELQDVRAAGCLRVDGPNSGCQSFFLACLRKPAVDQVFAVDQDRSPGEFVDSGLQFDPGLEGFPGSVHKLPPGKISLSQNKIFFSPAPAQDLPWDFCGQTFYLGRKTKKHINLWPRARILLPPAQEQETSAKINVQDVGILHRLLSGQSFSCTGRHNQLGLYWRNLPLGWVAVKNARMLWTEKG